MAMKFYIVRRLSDGLITIWVVTLVVFALLRLTGNPVDFLAPPDMPWADRAYLREAYGLDKPLWQQYVLFNKNIFIGDFGKSLRGTQGPALDVLLERVPATLQLTAAAMLFAIIVGVLAGVVSAARPNSFYDRIGKIMAIAGQSMPVFWVGLLLILVFTVWLEWLPSAGGMDRLGFQGLLMPAVSLGWLLVASHMRVVRSSVLDVLDADYIKMARVKGLPEQLVLWKHALKNAAIPVFTLFAVNFAHLVSGAVITETIFAWPGIGRLLVESIMARDFAVVQAVVFFAAAVIVVVNLAVDLLYAVVDPRIRVAA
jgi:peptide/nickel transport system permease protein